MATECASADKRSAWRPMASPPAPGGASARTRRMRCTSDVRPAPRVRKKPRLGRAPALRQPARSPWRACRIEFSRPHHRKGLRRRRGTCVQNTPGFRCPPNRQCAVIARCTPDVSVFVRFRVRTKIYIFSYKTDLAPSLLKYANPDACENAPAAGSFTGRSSEHG